MQNPKRDGHGAFGVAGRIAQVLGLLSLLLNIFESFGVTGGFTLFWDDRGAKVHAFSRFAASHWWTAINAILIVVPLVASFLPRLEVGRRRRLAWIAAAFGIASAVIRIGALSFPQRVPLYLANHGGVPLVTARSTNPPVAPPP
jgi:cytochrome bd-type quinol oxidase subunit 2